MSLLNWFSRKKETAPVSAPIVRRPESGRPASPDADAEAARKRFVPTTAATAREMVEVAQQKITTETKAAQLKAKADTDRERAAEAETDRKRLAEATEAAQRATESEAERNRIADEATVAIGDATFREDLAAVEALLGKGADVNSVDSSGLTPLHLAALTGRKDIAELLLVNGADIDRADPNGATPLLFASSKGHSGIVELLVASGADVNRAISSGGTPLYLASQNGHRGIAEFLIANGANLNSAISDGKTPLCIVSYNGHQEIAELLVAKGADLNRPDSNGWVPMHHATVTGHQAIVELLVASGANVNCADPHGLTPLHFAANGCQKEIAQVLVASGADINSPLSNGATPLHSAAAAGHKEIVELLVTNGANVRSATSDGKTPAHLATEKGHHEIVRLLAEKAKPVQTVPDLSPLSEAAPKAISPAPISSVNKRETTGQKPLTFTDANFDREVLDSQGIVLVEVWAEWWREGRKMADRIELIANLYDGKVKVGRLDVDRNSSTALRYGIRAVPTLLVFKKGCVAEKIERDAGESEIRKALDAHIEVPKPAKSGALPSASSGAQPELVDERIDDLAARLSGAVERHIRTKLEPQLRNEPVMLQALRKVDAVFRQTSRVAAEKAELSASGNEMQSFCFRDASSKVRLEITTIPCRPEDACAYFSRIPPGGYAEFMSQMMYRPAAYEPARAEGTQIFAHLVVVSYADQGTTRVVVHLCMLPHGDGNQLYCPVGITPTDLFSEKERSMYGL